MKGFHILLLLNKEQSRKFMSGSVDLKDYVFDCVKSNLNNVPSQLGAGEGTGHDTSALGALQVIDASPTSLNPVVQVKVATLPCWLLLLLLTIPFAKASSPVHSVSVQVLLVARLVHVMVPLKPGKH